MPALLEEKKNPDWIKHKLLQESAPHDADRAGRFTKCKQ